MNHANHHERHKSDKNNHSGGHMTHMRDDFKKRFYISLALTAPVFLLSPMIGRIFGISISFPGDIFVLLFLSTVIFIYGGKPFFVGAKKEFREINFGMMTLVALAIGVAYFYSLAVAFGLEGEVFFWELVTLVDIMLLGHWIEMRSVMGASSALEKLSKLIPDNASLKKDGEILKVKTSDLKKGDIVLVRPGEVIPSDGVVLKGEASVNQASFTGESVPVMKKKKDGVIGGSINEEGSLEIKVSQEKSDSYVSRVVDLVQSVQMSKSKTQLLADRAAFYLTIVGIISGLITFLVWFFVSGTVFALERSVTVLVITCPHALGLAIPLVASISTALLSQNGLLVRNRDALENSRKITMVVFDKTGTLTKGEFGVDKIKTLNHEVKSDQLLRIVASLESNSEHPIARAIMREAKNRHLSLDEVDNFKVLRGKGVEGDVNGRRIAVISVDYADDFSVELPEESRKESGTVILVVEKDSSNLLGYIIVSDQIRNESFSAIEDLKAGGIKTWMLSGDNEKVTEDVSRRLKLDGFFASVLPHQKQEKIKELQEQGEFVAMVGDGVNDAPAIAQADVGIAIGEGTDIASDTADVILIENDPGDVGKFIFFGKAVYSKMMQNIFWATGYNLFAIPLAAGVLVREGIILSPAIGAVLMSVSTVIVAVNAKSLSMNKKR